MTGILVAKPSASIPTSAAAVKEWRHAADLLFHAENPKLVQLSLFFNRKENMEWILPLFIKTKKHITKTLIEWTIIKLARLCPLTFVMNGETINIADEYAIFRSQGTKEHSDPFCRKPRGFQTTKEVKFDFVYDGSNAIETTEAQLTFLRWTIVRGILPYITESSEILNQLYMQYSKLKSSHHQVEVAKGILPNTPLSRIQLQGLRPRIRKGVCLKRKTKGENNRIQR